MAGRGDNWETFAAGTGRVGGGLPREQTGGEGPPASPLAAGGLLGGRGMLGERREGSEALLQGLAPQENSLTKVRQIRFTPLSAPGAVLNSGL